MTINQSDEQNCFEDSTVIGQLGIQDFSLGKRTMPALNYFDAEFLDYVTANNFKMEKRSHEAFTFKTSK